MADTDAGDVIADRGKAAAQGPTSSSGGGYVPGAAAGMRDTGLVQWDTGVQAYWGLNVADVPQANRGGVSENTQSPVNSYGGTSLGAAGGGNAGVTTIQALQDRLASMGTRERLLLQKRLEKAGYLKEGTYRPGAADDVTIAGFGDLLRETAREGMAKHEDIAWQDYLADRVVAAKDAEDDGPRTTTQSTTTDIDPTDAGQAFRAAIGRSPSKSELDSFMSSYNSSAKARVTTNTVDKDGNQTSHTTGGFDQEQAARTAAGENPEYASYQAVATFMPALEQALQADTGLGSGQVG